MKRKGMEYSGSITIYFSLLILIMFAVLSTTIESSRLAGVRVRCQSAAFLGLESVFADYSVPLLEEYGLLFLDKTYGSNNPQQAEEHLRKYVDSLANPNQGLWIKGSDFYDVDVKKLEIISETAATEKGGQVLEEEIMRYMKNASVADMVEWVLEQMDVLRQAETVKEVFERMGNLRDKADHVDKVIRSMHEGLKTLREFESDIKAAASGIESAIDALNGLRRAMHAAETDEEREWYEGEIEALENSIAGQVSAIIGEQGFMLDYTNYVLEKKDSYEEGIQTVQDSLLEIEKNYADRIEEMEKELKAGIGTEMESIRVYSGGKGDYYCIEDGTGALKKNKGILEGNISCLEPYTSPGNTGGLVGALSSCVSAMAGYEREGLKLNYDDSKVEKEGTDVIEEIERLIRKGIMGFLIENEGELSTKKIEGMNEYRTILGSTEREDTGLFDKAARAVMIDEYILKKFGNILDIKEDRPLDYEVEYLLNERNCDYDNLAQTVDSLLIVREGMNLIYLMGNEQKRTEAELLAVSLVGFTGMYGLIKVVQLLILAVWAFGEALIDVRTLLDGGSVSLFKSDSSWNLSLTGLSELRKKGIRSGNSDIEKGLCYQDYLRLLLLKEEALEKDSRIIFLIEKTVQKNRDETFVFSECVTDMEIAAEFQAKQMFFTLPFMTAYTKNKGNYRIYGTCRYKY